MPLIPDIKIRGIRTPIPSGYVLGRTQAGHGDVHLIPIDKIGGVAGVGGGGGGGGGGGSAGSGAGGGAGSSSGTGGGGSGGVLPADLTPVRIAANTALQLAQMGASNFGGGEAEDGGGTTFIGFPGAAGATGAASTVPGPTGPPGIGFDGIDGQDGLPIPGSIGATGATGAASTVPGPPGPPGIALDGDDGVDGLPLPGPAGPTGETGAAGTGAWDTTVVTTSDHSTTNVSATDIPELSIALAINNMYELEAILIFNSSSAAGCKASINYSSAGATTGWLCDAEANATRASSSSHTLNGLSTTFATVGSGSDVICYIKGWLKTGANSGNLTAEQAKVTSGTSIVRKNSLLRIRLIGAN